VEILVNILSVAHEGALKTHIMYKANLSHTQLDKYLTFLQGNGMLRAVPDPEGGKSRYEITDKGLSFLKEYARLSNYFTEKKL